MPRLLKQTNSYVKLCINLNWYFLLKGFKLKLRVTVYYVIFNRFFSVGKVFQNWLCQYLFFLNIFFNSFHPVEKCGVTLHCLYRDLLTLKNNICNYMKLWRINKDICYHLKNDSTVLKGNVCTTLNGSENLTSLASQIWARFLPEGKRLF